MSVLGLSCTRCNAQYPIGPLFYGCPACHKKGLGGALTVVYDYPAIAKTLDREAWGRHSHSIWRFKDLLPVQDPAFQISLGEGNTALVQPRVVCETAGLPRLYIKNETTNPTWAFKDRFHASSISMAKAMGYTKVTASTTGNHGASTAAYSAAAGMKTCAILCHPESSPLQRNIIRMYGGHAFVLENRYQYLETFVNDHGFYPSTTMEPMPVGTPFGIEGYKTIAFEVYAQLGGKTPDRMFFPIAAGDVLYGPWKGFRELKQLGIADRLPVLHGIQPAGCNPYVQSFRQGLHDVITHPDPRSIALSIRDDMGGRPALEALYESGGDASDVSEEEIVEAVHLLARSGFLVEPSSAASVAGAVKAGRQGRISRDDTVVCIVTGSGAKWPEVVEKLVPSPTPVEPTWDDICRELGL
ncbi:MAG: pyridoxal-phosphate dependent enzyme [candidate division Zixibacteria bacterium]|nr:pyridoxal-phosphate dependent enzyme [candidate division Zixibacteria bacterium]